MTRIYKKLNFFKRNHNLIFGFLWLGVGITYFLNIIYSEEQKTFNLVMAVFYVILAALYFYQEFRSKENKGEYIEWDDDNLNYKIHLGKLHSYKISSLIKVVVSENNLIIKAPNSQGTMASLKNYSEEDLQKLRSRFASS